MRIKLIIKYNGTHYYGWQRLGDKPTIQGEIENALYRIHRRRTQIYGASRTDAGVHADGQVAHFIPLESTFDINYVQALNQHLPNDIRILSSEGVADNFHARESSQSKLYEYYLAVGRSLPYYCAHWTRSQKLDVELMNKACQFILGEHDFKSFQSSGSRTKTSVRKILEASWRTEGDKYIFHIHGTAFLKYMIRNLVGTLSLVGSGKISVSDFVKILNKKNRSSAGSTAP
ncbi:MAG: tRNA pseudouridine(38-40) synthase TruA, partial [Deltaproteobacteria bacterium]|nr:tRNA pseudouridine(38-40) synthase TruA [Deltaproteobacteria bacterium]